MEKVVFNLLKENRLVLATAESCTGGLLAGKITDIPGSSEVFERGYVTYSNRAKAEDLGVSWDTLNKYGAVSRETAVEMVTGLKNKTGASAGVAITGIAGPGGGTEEKPVGLVYVAAYVNDNIVCKKLQLSGNRERIRNDSCLNALDMLRRLILGMEQR